MWAHVGDPRWHEHVVEVVCDMGFARCGLGVFQPRSFRMSAGPNGDTDFE